MSKWTDRNYSAVVHGKRNGKLAPVGSIPCQRCGVPYQVKHHEDYKKPLEVTYLCCKCHCARHKELGWGVGSGEKAFYNFSKIPVGNFAVIPDAKVADLSPLIHYFSKATGEKYKSFQWEASVVVFRLK